MSLRPSSCRFARCLLRAHVTRGPDGHACLSQLLPACCRDRAALSEVAHDRLPGFEQDVLWLMSRCTTPRLWRVAQRGRHFAGDPQCILERQLLLPRQPLAQRLALDVRHDVVKEARGLARIVKRQDVWVGKGGDGLDLAEEPLQPRGPRRAPAGAPLMATAGGASGPGRGRTTPSPLAQLPFDCVALDEGGLEADEEVSHVGVALETSALPKSTVSAACETRESGRWSTVSKSRSLS